MSQSKVHKIEVKNLNPGSTMVGARTQVLIDGVPLKGCVQFKFEAKAGSLAKVSIELIADVDFDISLPIEFQEKVSKVKGKITPMTANGKLIGATATHYVLGNYSAAKMVSAEIKE